MGEVGPGGPRGGGRGGGPGGRGGRRPLSLNVFPLAL